MTTKFSMIKDINGANGFGLVQSDTKAGVVLTNGVEQNIDVPTDAANYLAIFVYQSGESAYVSINGTATVYPAVIGSVNSELSPVARKVKRGDNISLITSDPSASVGILYYDLQ